MRCVDKIPAWQVWDQIARAHHDASNISDGGPVGRLKDRSLPHSCEGSYQLVPWIDLFSWMFCFQIWQSRNLPFVSHKSCTHIHVDARERAREQSKERSGVRVQKESQTGERHTSHGRVKPKCLARKYRPCQRFAPCKTDFEKRMTVLHPKRSIDKIQWFEWNFILSSFHWNGTMECEKVYKLFSVAFLPSIAWGWVSNPLREWVTVKHNAYPLGTF